MTTTQSATASRSTRHRTIMAISRLIELIRNKPKLSEARHKAEFWKTIRDDEEYLEALIYEWLSIKYSTAQRIALPPTREQLDAARTERERLRKAAEEAIKANAARMILLDIILPNGKPLRDCTGKECAKVGGWLTKIAAKVKPHQKVGAVLSEDQVREIFEGL
jgi:hypothetical protein